MPSNQIEAFAKRSRALVKKKKEEIRRLLAEQSDHRRRRARGIDLPKGGHDPVTDSSFLLIPAFDGDDGTRPIPSGVPAWHSPAVNVISAAGDPNTPLEIAQGRLSPQLIAGQGYVFEAWVHNLGDMAAPTVNVEFYKRLPGMGANSDNADFLGATVISVPRNDKARATLPYQATVADAGHWCLHVRASSFNPPDTPDNWSSLSARQERHVGQQNITVVQASSEMVVAVSALLIGATKSRKMQLVIEPQAPPKHLAKNACVAGVLGMRKGLARARFQLQAEDRGVRLRSSRANRWSVTLTKGHSHHFRLELPKHGSNDKSTRVYSVQAWDVQNPRKKLLVDGLTLLIQPES